MSKRGENIRKRNDGRWEARVLCKYSNGKVYYHSVYGKSYKDVKKKKDEFIKGETSLKVSQNNKSYISFEQLLIMWLKSKDFNQKKSTQLKYKNVIELHILPELGNMDILHVDDILINQFLISKRERGRLDGKGGLSNSYVKTMAIIISSSLNYAVERELRPPLKRKIQKPTVSKREITILPASAQQIYESRLNCSESPTALGILIALNTGLRIGEICALKWEDIDYSNRIIKVRHSIIRIASNDPGDKKKTKLIIDSPKTKTSIRDIPINTKLYNMLLNVKDNESGNFVVSGSSVFVSPRTFEYRFHQTLNQFDLEDINFHALRHTFATRCVEHGVDIKTLSEVLGHSDVSITLNAYVHPSLESKRKQLEKLNQL